MAGGPQGARLGFWYRFVVALLRPLLRLLTRQDWAGAEHLPRTGGVVVATNHVSHIDPLTFAHFLWDNGRAPRFLGKHSVFRVPVVGRIIKACGQIPVLRESQDATHAFTAAVAAVNAGECVVIYPEGTVTRDPDGWPMTGKTGAARVALATGCPVVPVAQWGAQEVLAPYSGRPHLRPRRTMHVVAGPPVDLDDLRHRELTPVVLHDGTERIMTAITELLAGIRGEPAPTTRFDPRAAGVPLTGNPRAGTTRPRGPRRSHDPRPEGRG